MIINVTNDIVSDSFCVQKFYWISESARKVRLLIADLTRASRVNSHTQCCGCNISNTRDSVSSGYPNTEKRVGNTTRSGVFLTEFEVFGWPMKHCLECLIYVLN